MKASTYHKYGSPSVLKVQEIDKPAIKESDVLVKVLATTVNRTDCANLRAKPFIMRFVLGLIKPRKNILGTDFAGIVQEVGSLVKNFKPGDKVFGFEDVGLCSHAEYLSISEARAVLQMPKNISFKDAVTSLEGLHYAYNMINKINLAHGDKVLVNGGTGAIGSAAIQLLSFFGANVTAVGDPKHLDLMSSLGANRVLDHMNDDFTKEDHKYKYIFDAVGKSSFVKCKPLLVSGGVYISSELGRRGANIFHALYTPFYGDKRVIFPIPKNIKDSIKLACTMIDEGKFKAVIDREYQLEEIAEAFNYVLKGHKIGNVVITFNH